MATNKSADSDEISEERERCVIHAPDSACEKLLYNLATNARVSQAMKLVPLLCPSCAQKLSELLTTRGLGAKRDESIVEGMRLKAGAPAKWDYDGFSDK